MTADRTARSVGLTLGVLLGLAVVSVLARGPGALGQEPAQEPAEDEVPTWVFELPALPAGPADPERPADPVAATRLAETP